MTRNSDIRGQTGGDQLTGDAGGLGGDVQPSGTAGAKLAAQTFLQRFVARGWLHGTRDDPAEQEAVDLGLRKRWLRRELGEVHFTPAGRAALNSEGEG